MRNVNLPGDRKERMNLQRRREEERRTGRQSKWKHSSKNAVLLSTEWATEMSGKRGQNLARISYKECECNTFLEATGAKLEVCGQDIWSERTEQQVER